MADPAVIPKDVRDSTKRGRKAMKRDAAKRRLCMRFEKGDTYWYINDKSLLVNQSTITNPNGTGKPLHRIRNKYNFIRPIVEAKVSAATQRVPSYEITPTTTDLTTLQAASLAELVARYGYDKWNLRRVTVKTVKNAIAAGGDGFALPYFDPNVGPYVQMPDGGYVGQGEVKVLVLNGNQCYWEDGTAFEDSPWWAIERARPIPDVKQTPGFIPGLTLTADASTSDIPTDKASSENLVTVTEYFERPCPKYPQGRCMVFANDRPIVDYRLVDPTCMDWWGPYPLVNAQGQVLDEPILHRLSYTVDPDDDHDLGLVWQLIDFQRTIQDAYNKLLEWKNRCLNPQMLAPVGSLVTSPDDVPGAVRYYRAVAGQIPQWENPPPVPQSLFEIIDRAVSDMRAVASDQQIDPAPNLSSTTVTATIEESMNRWQSFLGDVADFHSRLMRHCLLLVGRYYTEPRLLEIRGRDGWQLIPNFRGSDLLSQSQVRVLPDSLAPITRQGVQDKLTWLNQNFPGYLTPEAALAAMESGNFDRLTQSYWLDVARANTVIQKIMDGTVLDMPDRHQTQPVTNPMTGQQTLQIIEVPSFMPSDVDNLKVWKSVFGDFMKSDSFQRLDPAMQEVANQVWSGLDTLEFQRAARQAALQSQIASQQGLANAAKPQVNGTPSLPGSQGTPPPLAVTQAAQT